MFIKESIGKKGSIFNFNKNIILYCVGKFISVFGTSVYTFATGIYILNETGSALGFATNLILSTIPMLVIAPFGGVIADRVNKKKLVVSMDMINGVFLLFIWVMYANRDLSIWIIYFSTIIITALTTLFDLGMESSKPNLVSEENIVTINSVGKIIDSLSSILGPVIGGIIFAIIDIKLFILVNGLSFIISAVIEMFMNFNYLKKENKLVERKSYIEELKEGIIYISNKKNIKKLLFIFILYNICISFSISIPLPFILNNVFHVSTLSYGIIQGSLPIGMIIGSILVKRIMKKLSDEKIFIITGVVLAGLMILMSSPIILLMLFNNINIYSFIFMMIIFVLGLCFSIVDIPFMCIMQTEIEEEFRGRALSIVVCMIKIFVPISYAISGFSLEFINSFYICLIGGLTTLLGVFIFIKHK